MAAIAASAGRVIELPCLPWKLEGEGAQTSIEPIKGSWTLTPHEMKELCPHRGILACPHCGTPKLIPDVEVRRVVVERVPRYELPGFHCVNCNLHGLVILLEWDKRKLYCIVYETKVLGSPVKGEKEYLHAENQAQATQLFWAGRKHSDCVMNVVGVAPVFGYFVVDKEGAKLTV